MVALLRPFTMVVPCGCLCGDGDDRGRDKSWRY